MSVGPRARFYPPLPVLVDSLLLQKRPVFLIGPHNMIAQPLLQERHHVRRHADFPEFEVLLILQHLFDQRLVLRLVGRPGNRVLSIADSSAAK